MERSFRLDARELGDLDRDGYVVRRGLFAAAELDALGLACEDLIQRLVAERRRTKHVAGSYKFEIQRGLGTIVKWEPDRDDVVQGVEPFAHLSEALHGWALDPRFMEPMKDIVGTDSVGLFTEKLNLKRARVGGPIVLHQDYPYWVDSADDAARIGTALLFVDDATLERGCLEVVPGSHRQGEQVRRDVPGFGTFEMDPDKYDTSRLVAVEVPAGSVLYFGPFLVHRSLPNRSSDDRRALLFSYQPAGHRHMLDSLRAALTSTPA
jgi:hypothetical protein